MVYTLLGSFISMEHGEMMMHVMWKPNSSRIVNLLSWGMQSRTFEHASALFMIGQSFLYKKDARLQEQASV